jgi:hypothetical protein
MHPRCFNVSRKLWISGFYLAKLNKHADIDANVHSLMDLKARRCRCMPFAINGVESKLLPKPGKSTHGDPGISRSLGRQCL